MLNGSYCTRRYFDVPLVRLDSQHLPRLRGFLPGDDFKQVLLDALLDEFPLAMSAIRQSRSTSRTGQPVERGRMFRREEIEVNDKTVRIFPARAWSRPTI